MLNSSTQIRTTWYYTFVTLSKASAFVDECLRYSLLKDWDIYPDMYGCYKVLVTLREPLKLRQVTAICKSIRG